MFFFDIYSEIAHVKCDCFSFYQSHLYRFLAKLHTVRPNEFGLSSHVNLRWFQYLDFFEVFQILTLIAWPFDCQNFKSKYAKLRIFSLWLTFWGSFGPGRKIAQFWAPPPAAHQKFCTTCCPFTILPFSKGCTTCCPSKNF